ncbi:MAG: hypothetical protein AAGK14_01515 [Verrucomicrobiota bacterium]
MESKRAGLLFALAVAVLGLLGALWLYANREAVVSWAVSRPDVTTSSTEPVLEKEQPTASEPPLGSSPLPLKAADPREPSQEQKQAFLQKLAAVVESGDREKLRELFYFADVPSQIAERNLNHAELLLEPGFGQPLYLTLAQMREVYGVAPVKDFGGFKANLEPTGMIVFNHREGADQRGRIILPVAMSPQGQIVFPAEISTDIEYARLTALPGSRLSQVTRQPSRSVDSPSVSPELQARLDEFEAKLSHAIDHGTQRDRLRLFDLKNAGSNQVKMLKIEPIVKLKPGQKFYSVEFKPHYVPRRHSFLGSTWSLTVVGRLQIVLVGPGPNTFQSQAFTLGRDRQGELWFAVRGRR